MPIDSGTNPAGDLTIVPATQLDADLNGGGAVSAPATVVDPNSTGNAVPDPATLQRLIALGKVGTCLWERANDNTFETDYLVALQDLTEFEAGINQLQLEPVVKKGMGDLISYLRQKIQKRMRNSVTGVDTA